MRAGGGSYGTLAFGPGTKYPVVAIDGVLDLPAVRSRDLDRGEDHGAFSLPDYVEPRTVTLTLGLRAADATELAALESVLRATFQPVSEPQALYLFDSTLVLYAKPRRRALPMDVEYLQRLGQAVIEFTCPDPRLYAEPASAAGPTRLPSSSAVGFGAPISPPFGTGGTGAGGDTVVVNSGSTYADAVYTIAGPVTNPVVRNNTTGDQMAFTITVAAGDTLVVDTAARTVLLNGTASRRSTMQPGSRYPRLAPGSNTIQFRGAGGLGAMAVTRTNLATDPNMETVSGTVVTRTNLFPNPVAQIDVVSWSALAGTGGTAAVARQSAQTGWASSVTTSARVTWSVATTAVSGGIALAQTAAGTTLAGRKVGAAMQVRCSKAQTVAVIVDWFTAAGAYISSSSASSVALVANTVTNLSISATAPATADRAGVYVAAASGGTVWAIGDWLEATMGHVEETDQVLTAGGGGTAMTGTFVANFGAGTFGADYTYTWAGTAHASASQQRAPAFTQYGTGNGPSVTRSTEQASVGLGSMKIGWVYTVSATGVGDANTTNGLVVGQTYTYSRDVFVPTGQPAVQLQVDGFTTPASGQSTVTNAWQRLSMTFVATATSHGFRVVNAAAVQRGDYCYTDAMLIEAAGSAGTYFDGATAAGTYDSDAAYAWTGTANASTSTQSLPSSYGTLSARFRSASL